MKTEIYKITAIMLSVASIAAAFAISFLGSKFLQSSARQPDLLPKLRNQFFIIVGMLEFMPVLTAAIALYLIFVIAPSY